MADTGKLVVLLFSNIYLPQHVRLFQVYDLEYHLSNLWLPFMLVLAYSLLSIFYRSDTDEAQLQIGLMLNKIGQDLQDQLQLIAFLA